MVLTTANAAMASTITATVTTTAITTTTAFVTGTGTPTPTHTVLPDPETRLDSSIRILHYAYPIILLVFFLVSIVWVDVGRSRVRADSTHSSENGRTLTGPGGRPLPKQNPHLNVKPKANPKQCLPRSQRLLFGGVALCAAATFIANAANVIFHALYSRHEPWWCGKAVVVYVVGSFFVYSLFVIHLTDSKSSPTIAHFYTWLLALVMELALLAAGLARLHDDKNPDPAGKSTSGKSSKKVTAWDMIEVSVDLARIICLLGLLIIFLAIRGLPFRKRDDTRATDDETTGLLSSAASTDGNENGSTNGEARSYATIAANGHGHGHGHGQGGGTTPAAPAGWARPDKVPTRSWWEYLRGYAVIFPYLWPSKDRRLQLVVIFCMCLMILQRVVNVLVPYQVGLITNVLAEPSGPVRMPWKMIMVFILYRLLQGNQGLLGALRSTLWVPVSQYSYRELAVASFEHVHSLSLDFHLGKKTGEVLSALGKGNSVNGFLEAVTFQVLPMLFDLAVAIAYFLVAFDVYYALIVAVVTFWYVYLTIRMAQWRNDIRREMTNADRAADAVKNDSMISYETVKYFNAEAYEFTRYRTAVKKFQRAEYLVLISLNLLNVTQNLVFMLGLMIACFVAAYQVSVQVLDVGKFSTLLTYMAQLQAPLNFFGTFYRIIQTSMINSERMLELFKEQPTVVDNPDVGTLAKCEGEIRFQDVHFTYDNRKPALQGLDFQCKPGTTTAFVGESGGGKSTVFRLLFRFYNIQGGRILIDGHDVEDLSIDSVRRHIGVVPQDTVLFNESLMYNLRYARPEATDDEIFEACRAASIHDRIVAFPDGYNTLVGERGLRLSGGEKQRVAIARTILKGPRIIMLDEATAALDTETEQHIQEALDTLSQGRTMLVIAHRLSTITRADQILVLHEGRVAESGNHEQLLAQKGRYASMWRKQVKAQRAAEVAEKAHKKAERLRRESKEGVPPQLDGEGEGSSSITSSDDELLEATARKLAASEAAKKADGAQ